MIRKLNQIFKLDMEYLFKSGAFLLGTQFYESILSLVVLFLLGKFLSKETFGNYSLVIAFLSTLSVASLPGMSQAVARSVALGYEGVIFSAVKKSLKFSLLGSLGLAIAGAYFLFWGKNLAVSLSLLALIPLFPLIYSFNNSWSGFVIGKKLFKISTILSSASNSITTAVLVLAAYLTRSVPMMILAFAVSTIVTNYLIFVYTVGKVTNKKTHNETSDYGFFLTKATLLNGISLNFDQVFLGFVGTPLMVANYRVASSMSNVVKNVYKALANVIIPKMAGQQSKDILKKIKEKLLLVILMGFGITVALMVVQPTFIKVFFSNRYNDAVPFAQVIALSTLLFPLEVILYNFLISKMMTDSLRKYNVYTALFRIGSILILYVLFGFWGVVVSAVISRLFGVLMYPWLVKEQVK